MKTSGFRAAGILLAAVIGGAASAQTPTSGVNIAQPCPDQPVTVYFASGDIVASPQALAVLDRIGEVATACRPAQIDLVARVNAAAEGENAMALALERLTMLSRELVSAGLSMDALRAIAQPATPAAGGLHQVDVYFRRMDPQAPAEAARRPVPPQLESSPV